MRLTILLDRKSNSPDDLTYTLFLIYEIYECTYLVNLRMLAVHVSESVNIEFVCVRAHTQTRHKLFSGAICFHTVRENLNDFRNWASGSSLKATYKPCWKINTGYFKQSVLYQLVDIRKMRFFTPKQLPSLFSQ